MTQIYLLIPGVLLSFAAVAAAYNRYSWSESKRDAFLNACETGQLTVAQSFIWFPSINPCVQLYEHALRLACRYGHLDIVQWLVQTFPQMDVHHLNEWVFRTACEYGHLHIPQWLRKTFPTINVYIRDNYAFYKACQNGHLPVVKWLYDTFPYINIHTGSWEFNSKSAFQVVCERNHVDVVNWFIVHVPTPRTCINDAFGDACVQGRLNIAEILLTAYPYLRHENRRYYYWIFYATCKNGQLEAAKWLLARFPKINVKYRHNDTLFHTHNPEVKRWLLTFYTAEEFWSVPVQASCNKFLTEWQEEVEPRRRAFMAAIAPHLPPLQI